MPRPSPQRIRTLLLDTEKIPYFKGYEIDKIASPHFLELDSKNPQLILRDFLGDSVQDYLKGNGIKVFFSKESFLRFQSPPARSSTTETEIICEWEDVIHRYLGRRLGRACLKTLIQNRYLIPSKFLFHHGYLSQKFEQAFSNLRACRGEKYIVMSNRPTHPIQTVELPYFIPVKRLLQRQIGSTQIYPLYKLSDKERLDRKFCCVCLSETRSLPVLDLILKLSQYKEVHVYGKTFLRNRKFPFSQSGKGFEEFNLYKLYKDYKFVLCFENHASESYITEKLLLALIGDSLPIYHGALNVGDYFNRKRFLEYIHWEPFIPSKFRSSISETVEKIIALDKDSEQYLSYLKEPSFTEKNKKHMEKAWNLYLSFMKGVINKAVSLRSI
ncbi:MAG: glycosyltransferase family 10 [Cytophagales bacterium]|nr:glycosyltransferase family 10 [Cytophagales bacterium]